MASFNKSPDKKITLEDLLRLKRDEKPPVEFWEGFERDLHRKTLRALVVNEPWYGIFLRPSLARMAIVAPLAIATATAAGYYMFYKKSEPPRVDVPAVIADHTATPVAPMLVKEIPFIREGGLPDRSRRQFANYIIMVQQDKNTNFITVRTSETFKANSAKAVYAADPLSGVDAAPVLISAPNAEQY